MLFNLHSNPPETMWFNSLPKTLSFVFYLQRTTPVNGGKVMNGLPESCAVASRNTHGEQ